jgi:group I intron endonuclease
MKNYNIYKIINLSNNKIYIGKTMAKDPFYRFKAHAKDSEKGSDLLLHRAIRKYGIENFHFEVIFTVNDASDLSYFEKLFIQEYNSCILDENSHGYNMTRGGEGFDSDFAKMNTRKQIENGTNAFAGKNGTELNIRMIANGSHPLAGERGRELQKNRVLNGTHPSQGEKGKSLRRAGNMKLIENGTHIFLNEEFQEKARQNNRERIENGSHNLLGENGRVLAQQRIDAGTHNFIKQYCCPHCGKVGKGPMMKRWHFNNCKQK